MYKEIIKQKKDQLEDLSFMNTSVMSRKVWVEYIKTIEMIQNEIKELEGKQNV